MKRRAPTPGQLAALKVIAAGRFYPSLDREEDGWYARWHSLDGEDGWVDELVRSATMTRMSEDAEEQRHETLHDAWMLALRSTTGRVIWDDAECQAFAEDLREWSGEAEIDVQARANTVFELKAGESGFAISCALPRGKMALKVLGQATRVCGLLRGMRRAGDRLEVVLSAGEAEGFVGHDARALADAGYTVRGCDLRAEITVAADVQAGASADSKKATLSLTVRVAGEPVTAEEVRFLLDQGSSLVYFRDRWIEVDRNILREALRVLERVSGRSVANPLAFALGVGRIGRLELDEISSHGWVRGLVNELRARGESLLPELNPVGFAGELRDYQRRGATWLKFMTDHGFGALLADDMGLGKTVQTIAWLLATPRNGPALIVAPLTLLANWRHELARFAPTMKVYVHQGVNRSTAVGFAREVTGIDVVLTSYNLLVKDYVMFGATRWSAMVLDEAQAIKNPDTRVARAARALAPVRRVALTGTPIENSVTDVWSIEEFLNPGFLGERRQFEERFPVRKLARALEPFVLRRLKSDRSIAGELGEKREIREYCVLSAAQRREYEAALDGFRHGERRHGDIFALITSLKLICDGEGKLARLMELVESIFENDESVLVFTQYAKVGVWLREELERRFARRFPFLHGGLSAAERERQIRDFNRPGARAFVLSLRAGGFGLNLTKATHVIHFDRWWNPAVENQATDRAHRIGQDQEVFVHTFITSGTIEEHIEDILARKAALSVSVISDSEWLEAAKLDE